jgi:hypothetical protein
LNFEFEGIVLSFEFEFEKFLYNSFSTGSTFTQAVLSNTEILTKYSERIRNYMASQMPRDVFIEPIISTDDTKGVSADHFFAEIDISHVAAAFQSLPALVDVESFLSWEFTGYPRLGPLSVFLSQYPSVLHNFTLGLIQTSNGRFVTFSKGKTLSEFEISLMKGDFLEYSFSLPFSRFD